MRRRFSILERLRSPARAEPAAWLVAAAILLQTVLGGPMALRMAASLDAGAPAGLTDAICADHANGDAPGDPPASHAGHDSCVVCQGALTPLLLTVAAALRAPLPAASPVLRAPSHRQTPQLPAHAYQSRGPPSLA
jgi:hypothetical protein